MRERLTISFILLTVGALAGALLIRSYSLQTDIRAHESAELRREAVVAKLTLEEHVELSEPVDTRFLGQLVGPQYRIVYAKDGQPTVTVRGDEFPEDPDGSRVGAVEGTQLVTEIDAAGGRLSITQSSAVVDDLVNDDRRSIIVLLLLVGIIAGLAGWLAARQLSAPFRKLAVAAELLGRGRFDLELPRSRLPEVRAISTALYGAAGRLQERLSREQEFAQHASHVLRTPLTGLRMELEELTLRDDVPTDARDTVSRSLDRIDSMNVVAGELVELSRRGALVAGSELPLRELATQCAQRWADTLAEHDRPLTAAVEGSLDTTYTPGPVEHILDLLLADVLRRGSGPVRMVFDSHPDGNLRIKITCSGATVLNRGPGTEVPITQARAVATALGGRLLGDDPAEGLEILLPRR